MKGVMMKSSGQIMLIKNVQKISLHIEGINGEPLLKTNQWYKTDPNLHFHDIPPYQKFLIEKYGTNDAPSTGHRELFFDIECEIGGALN